MVKGFGLRVKGLRVQGMGFGVYDVHGLGFMV
jgi:hypothetical protein